MNFLEEEGNGFEDEWESQGRSYEQTLMAFKNNAKYKPSLYYKHNYSKDRKKKTKRKKKKKKKFVRKKRDNLKKIQDSFGKPILYDNMAVIKCFI